MQDLKLMELNLIEKLSGEQFSEDDHSFEFQAALGYVISIRDNKRFRSRQQPTQQQSIKSKRN